MKRHRLYSFLLAVSLWTFASPAPADDFFADDIALDAANNADAQQAEPIVEPLPGIDSAAPPISQPPEPIPLPPIDPPASDARLTLAEAEALATSFHPALREAAGRIRAAQGNWLQVGLRPNPHIGYFGEEIGDSGTAGKQGGFISKEFVTAGKLRHNRAVASREVAQAEQQAEIARLKILTTVRSYYFDVLAAKRSLDLARQLNGIAAESVRVSELRLKAMDIPRVSLLQSQIERESTALLEQQATERHQAAWRRLAAVIGVNDTNPGMLDDAFTRPLPDLSWESTRDRVLSESPELSELRFAVDRARASLGQAAAGRVPNVDVRTGVMYDNAVDETMANVEVSVPLPVFDRNQGAIAQASGELSVARAALQEKELALEERLAAAMRDYATARTRVLKYAQNVLPIAKESLDMISAGYQEGELDYLAVLSIQQTYAEKNLSYLQGLELAWKRWAEIDGLLVGTLQD